MLTLNNLVPYLLFVSSFFEGSIILKVSPCHNGTYIGAVVCKCWLWIIPFYYTYYIHFLHFNGGSKSILVLLQLAYMLLLWCRDFQKLGSIFDNLVTSSFQPSNHYSSTLVNFRVCRCWIWMTLVNLLIIASLWQIIVQISHAVIMSFVATAVYRCWL